VFVVLAAVGLVLTACVWRWVPESLPVPQRGAGRGTFRVLGGFLRSRVMPGYLLTLGFTSAAMFTYISDSSFVFQTTYGLGTGIFSVVFASNALAMLLAGGAFGGLANRIRPHTMPVAGIGTLLLATAVHAVLVVLTGGNVFVSWICLAVAMAGTGLVFPAIMTIGQTIGSHAPGAMSALLGASQFLLGALVAPLAGLSGAGPLPMVLIMVGAAALACVALVSTRIRSRQETS
jgi:DHA1 family bicyclomycin/chloramphenicol resistance-like MFS transporter